MLIDDNKIDNMFHDRVIKKSNVANTVIVKESAQEALDFLKNTINQELPEIIFLDINMPGMNGWEFIEHYKQLDPDKNKSLVVVMLSPYEINDEDIKRKTSGIFADFKTKPITQVTLDEVLLRLKSGNTGH
jgi:CheY-like chemotaxis protein